MRVPRESLVGDAERRLDGREERCSVSSGSTSAARVASQGPLRQVPIVAKARGVWATPEFRTKYVPLHLDVLDFAAAYRRFAAIVSTGEQPGPEVSMLKIISGETTQRVNELLIEIAGSSGNLRSSQDFDGTELNLLTPYYTMFGATIAAGSNDIQRNIIAKRILNLP